jgi:hypothetical protein
MIAVTFEVVYLHTDTLSELVFALLSTFLELLVWYALQDGRRMSLNVNSVWKFVALQSGLRFFVIAKSHTGPNLVNMMDGPISLSIFWPKTPGHWVHYEQGHCHDARSEH